MKFTYLGYLFSILLHLIVISILIPWHSGLRIGDMGSQNTDLQLAFIESAPTKGQKNQKTKKTQKKKRPKTIKDKSAPRSKKKESQTNNETGSSSKKVQVGLSGKLGKKTQAQTDSVFGHYLFKVRKAIERNKFYPLMAKRKRHQGVVKVEFLVGRDGKVLKIFSINGPHSSLKKATAELLSENLKLPPIPKELQSESIRLAVPIRYQLDN